jgi:hypothetical protein
VNQAARHGARAADDAPGEDPLVVPPQHGRAAQRHHHEDAAPDLLDGVGAAHHPAPAAERLRQRRAHRQADQHRRDEQQPDLDAFRVHPVGDPGRVGPERPDHREQQRRLQRAPHGQLTQQEVRQLRDREDIHQVEEQLDVRDPLRARAVTQQLPRPRRLIAGRRAHQA